MITRQIVSFMLEDTVLGVDILQIKEIYRQMSMSPIPDAPPHLRGLMNLRGRVVTVVDLNVCLNRSPVAHLADRRLLILKTREEILNCEAGTEAEAQGLGEDIVGFLIDRMDDVLSLEESDILPAPANLADIDESLIKGVVKRGNRLVMLLDLPAVLDKVMAAISEKEERASGA